MYLSSKYRATYGPLATRRVLYGPKLLRAPDPHLYRGTDCASRYEEDMLEKCHVRTLEHQCTAGASEIILSPRLDPSKVEKSAIWNNGAGMALFYQQNRGNWRQPT